MEDLLHFFFSSSSFRWQHTSLLQSRRAQVWPSTNDSAWRRWPRISTPVRAQPRMTSRHRIPFSTSSPTNAGPSRVNFRRNQSPGFGPPIRCTRHSTIFNGFTSPSWTRRVNRSVCNVSPLPHIRQAPPSICISINTICFHGTLSLATFSSQVILSESALLSPDAWGSTSRFVCRSTHIHYWRSSSR